MALTALEQDTVSKGIRAAKYLVEQLKPILDELNIIYDSQGGAKATITQQGLDAISGFSGLTKSQLDDGMYALTAVIRGDLVNSYTQLAILAARQSQSAIP